MSVEITDREVPAGPRVVVGEGPFVVGGELVVRGTGLTPHATYEVWLESEPGVGTQFHFTAVFKRP